MGLTDLRKRIVTEYMLTPHDIESMYLSDGGSIYGTLSDKKLNQGFKHPKESAFVNNLYFGGGMPMVTLSGQNAAKYIAEKERLFFYGFTSYILRSYVASLIDVFS